VQQVFLARLGRIGRRRKIRIRKTIRSKSRIKRKKIRV